MSQLSLLSLLGLLSLSSLPSQQQFLSQMLNFLAGLDIHLSFIQLRLQPLVAIQFNLECGSTVSVDDPFVVGCGPGISNFFSCSCYPCGPGFDQTQSGSLVPGNWEQTGTCFACGALSISLDLCKRSGFSNNQK